jgi:cyclophilin family peptidyl-prolyl cis-trans isomerase
MKKILLTMKTLLLIFIPVFYLACANTPKKQNMSTNSIVRIETVHGNIDIRLYDETPKHRDNFIKLVNEGFYDDLLFHRVISNFMIQGGDPTSRNANSNTRLGSGGPGYTIPAEIHASLFHKKGTLAAARLGDDMNPGRESSGSQFYLVQGIIFSDAQLNDLEHQISHDIKKTIFARVFREIEQEFLNNNLEPDYELITQRANEAVSSEENDFHFTKEQREVYTTVGGTPHLDGSYTVFGETVAGIEVIDKIAAQKTDQASRPLTDVRMKMRILDN